MYILFKQLIERFLRKNNICCNISIRFNWKTRNIYGPNGICGKNDMELISILYAKIIPLTLINQIKKPTEMTLTN